MNLTVEDLVESIEVADKWLYAGEGINLLYYMEQCDDEDKRAHKILSFILKGEESCR